MIRRSKLKIIWILILTVIFLLPPSGIFKKPDTKKFVKIDRREPVSFPKKIDIEFPKLFEAYLQDRVFGRFSVLHFLSNFYFRFSSSTLDSLAVIGKNNWIFLGDDYDFGISKYRGLPEHRLIPIGMDESINRILSYQKFAKSKNIVAVAPDKSTVYPELLPRWVNKIGDYDRIQLFKKELNKLRGEDVVFLDLKDMILSSKNIYHFPLYYENDSHWNFGGAFFGYREIMKNIDPDKYFKEMKFNNSKKKIGDIANFLQVKDKSTDPRPVFETDNNWKKIIDFKEGTLESFNQDALPQASTWLQSFVNGSALLDKKVLVLGDSFFEMMSPYLLETFSNLDLIHYQTAFDIQSEADFNKLFHGVRADIQYDLVLFLAVQRVI